MFACGHALLHLHHAFSALCRPHPYPHLPDLIHCTNELNVSIPHLADTLLERTASNSWIVVFKALITTHHLMMYGNEVRPRKPASARARGAPTQLFHIASVFYTSLIHFSSFIWLLN